MLLAFSVLLLYYLRAESQKFYCLGGLAKGIFDLIKRNCQNVLSVMS